MFLALNICGYALNNFSVRLLKSIWNERGNFFFFSFFLSFFFILRPLVLPKVSGSLLVLCLSFLCLHVSLLVSLACRRPWLTSERDYHTKGPRFQPQRGPVGISASRLFSAGMDLVYHSDEKQ